MNVELRMVRRSLQLLATLLMVPGVSAAQADTQVWSLNVAQGRFGAAGLWYAEAQPRWTDDASRLGQLLLRPAIGVQAARRLQLHLGYAYIGTWPEGADGFGENRVWQQALWTPVAIDGGLRVVTRSRLEQRFHESDGETGWRIRQQVRAQHPLPVAAKRWQGIVWTEPFVGFNATAWGARRGVDQWRSFVGVGIPLAKGLVVEPGYMRQDVVRPNARRANHVLSLNVFYTLP